MARNKRKRLNDDDSIWGVRREEETMRGVIKEARKPDQTF